MTAEKPAPSPEETQFAADLETSKRFEASMFWREVLALCLVVALIVARQLWFV